MAEWRTRIFLASNQFPSWPWVHYLSGILIMLPHFENIKLWTSWFMVDIKMYVRFLSFMRLILHLGVVVQVVIITLSAFEVPVELSWSDALTKLTIFDGNTIHLNFSNSFQHFSLSLNNWPKLPLVWLLMELTCALYIFRSQKKGKFSFANIYDRT